MRFFFRALLLTVLMLGLFCPSGPSYGQSLGSGKRQGNFGTSRPTEYHPGYLSDISEELNQNSIEFAPVPSLPAVPVIERPLSERIFTQQLVDEFQSRYRSQFGHTDLDRTYNLANRYTYFESTDGSFRGTVEQASEAKKQFGIFVFRRLAEFHFDRYAKEEPAVRPVWELKERIRQVQVEISPGYKFSAIYSFSGNYLESNLVNPYVPSKVVFLMDPTQTGPTSVLETWVSLGYSLSPVTNLEFHYKDLTDLYSFVVRRKLTSWLEGSLLLSSGKITTNDFGLGKYEIGQVVEDPNLSGERDRRILFGLSW